MTRSSTPARGGPGSGGRRGGGRPGGRKGGSGGPPPTVRRQAHQRGLKLSAAAARGISAGHPWVFRDSVVRPVEGLKPGTLVRIMDESGGHLGWALSEPEGAIAARVVSRSESFAWDAEVMLARVRAAADHRETHLEPQVRGACRLVHGEGDGLPGLAVDRLGEFLLVYKYSLGAEAWLDALTPALEEVFAPAGIYMQDRLRPVVPDDRRPPAFHLAGAAAPPEIEVEEDGLRFVVDVTAPVSPGLFLDLREGRRLCEAMAPAKRVLNLFSFTGAFGVRAARANAATVTNVDAAARSHARCRQNLTLSGMDPEACTPLVGDVFKHLERLRQRNERFDVIIVDPPPFSRVKGRAFSALRDWHELMAALVAVADDNAEVLAISNASRLADEELMTALGRGALAGGRQATLIAEQGLPPDFPVPPAFVEGRYLKTKRLVVP